MVPEPEKLERYFSSLEKTLRRWNDLGKEFRKAPYRLERALKASYGRDAGAGPAALHAREAADALAADSMELFRGDAEKASELACALGEAAEEIDARLRGIARRTYAAKKIYALAMEVRESKLSRAIPPRHRGKLDGGRKRAAA
jgi:hypothetical protein